MMDAIASLLSEIGTDDWFVQVHMTVNDNRAIMICEDGNAATAKSMRVKKFRLRTLQCQRYRCMPFGTGSIQLDLLKYKSSHILLK